MTSILDPNLTPGARADLKRAILASVAEFDATDRNATVLLLRTALEGEPYEGVAAMLASAPLLHLAYVRSLFPRRGAGTGSVDGDSDASSPPANAAELGTSPSSPCALGTASAGGVAKGQPFELALAALPPAESLPASVHDTYLELMCAHASPAEVRDYLVAHDEYGLDAALKTTQQHGVQSRRRRYAMRADAATPCHPSYPPLVPTPCSYAMLMRAARSPARCRRGHGASTGAHRRLPRRDAPHPPAAALCSRRGRELVQRSTRRAWQQP
jgi:hypothetical protein